MIAATFLAGGIAIVFWLVLKICPSLWMFFLWMLLVGIYCAGKLYGVIASRFPPAFWSDVVVNILILVGPAVDGQRDRQGCLPPVRNPFRPVRWRELCTPGSRSPRWNGCARAVAALRRQWRLLRRLVPTRISIGFRAMTGRSRSSLAGRPDRSSRDRPATRAHSATATSAPSAGRWRASTAG